MRKVLTVLSLCLLYSVSNLANAADSSAKPAPDTPQISARIVGGLPTSITQVPATVALLRSARVQLDGNLFQAQFCGGTVIADRWILTAAHCVSDLQNNLLSADSIMVLTGSDDLQNPENQPIAVTQIIVHPEFRSVETGRDIALLELEYDSMVEPIALDVQSIAFDDLAFIAGWGATNTQSEDSTQSFPTQLRGAFVNMTPGEFCGILYPDYFGYTDATTVCAGLADGGKDSCQGDSGGPMYRVDPVENRIVSIAGITSWGISCGNAQNPGIYTNVASYGDWIQSVLNDTSEPVTVVTQPSNDDTPAGQELPPNVDTPSAQDNPATNVGIEDKDDTALGAFHALFLPLLFMLVLFKRNSATRICRFASPSSKNSSLHTKLTRVIQGL